MTVAKPKQCHLGSLVDRSKTSITHLTNQKSRRKYVTRRRQARKKDDRRQPANTVVFPAIRLVYVEDILVETYKSRKYTCVMGYGWVFWKFDWLQWFLVAQSFLEWRPRQAQNVYKPLRPDLFSYPLRFPTDRRGDGSDMCYICAYNSVYSSYIYKKTGDCFVPW